MGCVAGVLAADNGELNVFAFLASTSCNTSAKMLNPNSPQEI
jgi:hypothetical protein